MPGYDQWMEGRGIKPADLRPYQEFTNSNIGQLLDSPGNRDFQGLADELQIRQNVNALANAAQLTELGYNIGGNLVDIGAAVNPGRYGSLSTRLARANPIVNLATNVTQGAFTMGSGADIYGTGERPGAEVIALDIADAAPAAAAATFSGPLAPITTPIAQTLLGGAASAEYMRQNAVKNRPALLNNPPQQMVYHREHPDYGRNTLNQTWTGALNAAMQRRQDAFDKRYRMHSAPRYGDSDQEVLKTLRNRHGQLVADYDDAMTDQNWMQKSYYAIKELFGDEKAFDDFLAHSRGTRKERDDAKWVADRERDAELIDNPYAPRSRRALEATRYQSF